MWSSSSLIFGEINLENAEVIIHTTHRNTFKHFTITANKIYLYHSFFSQCINEEGFRLFLKTYLEVEDFPVDLCQRLFRSFQNSEPTQEDSASEIIKHVLTKLAASVVLSSRPLSVYSMAFLAYIYLTQHACVVLLVQIQWLEYSQPPLFLPSLL